MNAATDNDIKKSKGRPRVDSAPVMVRLSADQLGAIDDWRRLQEDLPGRPEAIRRLIEKALSSEPTAAAMKEHPTAGPPPMSESS
jgi:hypothetical protein